MKGRWYSSLFMHYAPVTWDVSTTTAIETFGERFREMAPPDPRVPELRMRGTGMREPQCEHEWCLLSRRVAAARRHQRRDDARRRRVRRARRCRRRRRARRVRRVGRARRVRREPPGYMRQSCRVACADADAVADIARRAVDDATTTRRASGSAADAAAAARAAAGAGVRRAPRPDRAAATAGRAHSGLVHVAPTTPAVVPATRAV